MSKSMISARGQRWMIWVGLALSVVFVYGYVFLMGFFPPPAPTLSAIEVAKLYSEHSLQFRIGVALMLMSGGFLLPWTIVIAVQLARDEKGVPIWAILEALAGTLSTLIFFLPAVFWAAVAAQVLVFALFFSLKISYLWYNLIGCAACMIFSLILHVVLGPNDKRDETIAGE